MKYFLISILTICFAINANSQHKVNVSKNPSWILSQDYNQTPEIDEEEISQGSLTLLADYQVNVPTEESYFRLVSKITNVSGVQSSSDINSVFDPTYQKLTFHAINIIRNGEIINKLNADYFQIIRREVNAEKFLYDGSYTAMLNISDVRVGDIIDFSYTIKGFNPIHKGKYANMFYLNDYVPIGKINIAIHTKKGINYKLYNTSLEPKIITKNNDKIYNWNVTTPDVFQYEEYIPDWKILLPSIAVSDYENWGDVVEWANQLFKQNTTLSSDLKAKISDINETHSTQGEKIQAALEFVQNDIRYLGLEYGIGSYKPNSSNKVFDQRYGDCKDKSLLLVNMLDELKVEAYPMLVNTTLKNTILDLPASPEFFDHCVVKVIDEKGRFLYYDPTISEQGGFFTKKHFPNYQYGLVIKENNKTFDTITSASDNNVTTLENYVIKDLKGKATLNVKTIYSDVEADRMRSYIKNSGKSSYHKELENFYANYHNKIQLNEDPIIEDDKLNNELTVRESYVIDSIWKPMPSEPGMISVEFVPSSLQNILVLPNMDNRKHPIQLPFPVSREHTTRIKLPQEWNFEKTEDLLSNDVFYYDTNAEYLHDTQEIVYKNYLKIQKPAIEPKDFEAFSRDINKMNNTFGFTIFIEKDGKRQLFKTKSSDMFSTFFKFIIAALLVIIGVLVYVVKSNNKKERRY